MTKNDVAARRECSCGAELNFLNVPHRNLQGSMQVTDAWLAELARRRKGRLATLDSGLAVLHSDIAVLLPQ